MIDPKLETSSSIPPITMAALRNRLLSLAARLSKVEEEADELAYLVDMMLEQKDKHGQPSDVPPGSTPSRRRQMLSPDVRELLRKQAQAGVDSIQTVFRSDGYAVVSIDGKEHFNLPPKLGTLLAVLAMDVVGGPSPDDFVPWKTTEEISALFLHKTGEPIKKHALANAVYRLRKWLFQEHGVNPYLVQTDANGAYRFAVRRGAPAGEP